MTSNIDSADGPYIVGIGGTFRADSATERTLKAALQAAQRMGARTTLLGAQALDLPIYTPDISRRSHAAQRLVREIRKADGLILASPVYHGGVSGLVKNAIDYVEDLSTEPSPYFQGRAIGLIATGAGWQGAVATLASMRSIVHALRGWPTPLGVAVNSQERGLDAQGNCISAKLQDQLETLAREIVDFAMQRCASAAAQRSSKVVSVLQAAPSI